ncbi:MAG: MXAN_5808 family serine peptidase [Pseudomonadota bacterium]
MIPKLKNFRCPLIIPFGLLLLLAITWSAQITASSQSSYESGKLVDRTLSAVGQHYFDPNRIKPQKMLDKALDGIQKNVPDVLITNQSDGQLSVTAGLASKRINARSMSRLSDLSRVLKDVLDFVIKHYNSKEDIKPAEIEYAAIEGLLEVLDPHSNFLTPKIFREFKVGTSGKFGGIGIVISIKDGMLTVIAPIEGTPAFRAGVQPGDRIVQIEDESTINMSLTDAVNKLRGDVGTKVNLIIERSGQPPKKIALKRAVINIDSVQHSVLTEDGKRIGYIKLKNFQDNTVDDVQAALAEFHKDGAKLDGLILDVRNNPGGLLNIASDITDVFLREGVIVTTVGTRNSVIDKSSAKEAGTEPDYPLVVLINEGSASASEIVAGALALNNRAIVAGAQSFGKGSVQTIFNLGDDAALKLTIAEYKPAGTESIQLVGITPDIDLIPAIVDADEMNILKDKPTSELDLEMEFDKKSKMDRKAVESLLRVQYLKPKQDEIAREEKSSKIYLKKADINGDFPAEFARMLIAKAGSKTRKEMLAKSKKIVDAAQAKQREAIDKALSSLSIDWSKAPASGKPKLALSYFLTKGGKIISHASAGDKVRLELVATNKGTGPYSQLIGISESEIQSLNEREFPFGRIEPGKSRKFSTPLEIAASAPTQDLTMEVTFQEAGNIIPEPVKIVVPVQEIPHPSFSFMTTLPEQAKGKSFSVNGTSIPLTIDIINTGKGPSDDETIATISNECGEKFFIEKGRANLGSIPPKGSRKAQFKFHITGKPEEECSIQLIIADLAHRKILTKKINLLLQDGSLKPAPGKVYGPPEIEVASFPKTTSEPSIVLSGTIHDKDRIQDFYLFSGERKIAYIPNADDVSSMPFSVRIPLEEGQNQINIGARDVENITGQKLLIIERSKK